MVILYWAKKGNDGEEEGSGYGGHTEEGKMGPYWAEKGNGGEGEGSDYGNHVEEGKKGLIGVERLSRGGWRPVGARMRQRRLPVCE
jgi:hypothetical protein